MFQHYKNRRPPWVKLHRDVIEKPDFLSLPVASQALAPRLWLLASETMDGSLPATVADIAWHLRMDEAALVEAMKPLIEKGFLDRQQNGSGTLATMLASVLQPASPETEGEAEGEATHPTDVSSEPAVDEVETLKTWLDALDAEWPRELTDDEWDRMPDVGRLAYYARHCFAAIEGRSGEAFRYGPADLDVVSRWRLDGIPLRVALTGIRECGGTPKNARYADPAVREEFIRWHRNTQR